MDAVSHQFIKLLDKIDGSTDCRVERKIQHIIETL